MDIVILSATRTPLGAFQGALSSVPAARLGAAAIKGAVAQAGVNPHDITDCLMGNVLQAGQGQAPARQAAIYAGLPTSVRCVTVHKVCGSGMQTVMGAQIAVDEINAKGGVLGRKLKLDWHNDNADGTLSGQLFKKLVSDGAVAIVGSPATGPVTAQLSNRYKILDIGVVDGGGLTVYPDGPDGKPHPWVFSIGGNETAALFSGIAIGRVKASVYVISGLLASLAGIVLVLVQGQAKADLATGYELDIIASAVVGGASLAGGRGSVMGAVLGTLIFGVLRNALPQIPGATFYDRLIVGVVVIIIVVADQLLLRRSSKS